MGKNVRENGCCVGREVLISPPTQQPSRLYGDLVENIAIKHV